ncbi:sensor domain-containing phosphodiesterase [Rhodobacter maris]|uniref:EAL domain-containing protein (Putative c-di-GMP-specific phosphodiesterase class I) n=1 Tax=Rhodobacter maris TaxID=446682 RepID=A0A285RJZ9_9RHOB|nr:EAL domain-containing protein [Rhodobacter maris]SOB93999.1 EAL domain-containing protein (putative c-di-GMP-specific phosphodiesterase class I) [Rhodobacter maris]
MDITWPFRGAPADGVIGVDAFGRIDFANAAAAAMFGYLESEMLGQMINGLVPECTADPRAGSPAAEPFANATTPRLSRLPFLPHPAAKSGYGASPLRLLQARHRDGHDFTLEVSVRHNPASGRLFAFVQPAEPAEGRIGNEIEAQSRRPTPPRQVTTRLPTAEALRADLDRLLETTKTRGDAVCVVLVDVAQLGRYRATEARRNAEMLDLACATRLRGAQTERIRLYQTGENRFAYLVALSETQQTPEAALAAIGALMQEPLRLGAHMLHLEAAIGHASAPAAEADAEALLSDAGLALTASQENCNRPVAYDPALRRRVEHCNRVLLNLRQAIEAGEFELHYQPQVALETGAVVAVEALLRWRHPDWGLLMPGSFMEVLGASDLSIQVGEWVLREACTQVAEWNRRLAHPLTIAVNVFPRQFDPAILPAQVRSVLAETGLEPSRLEVEITEDIVLASAAEREVEVLAALRGLGVGLVLDDFGTGYASLASLARHKVDKIKIDKSFVDGLGAGMAYRAILESMRNLAVTLGLGTVVEGVENEAAAAQMRALGFDVGQGYLWGRPLTARACAHRLGLVRGGALIDVQDDGFQD